MDLTNFILVWLLVGFLCSVVALFYDSVINNCHVDLDTIKGMVIMILFGIIAIPVLIYLLATDDNIKTKK